MTSGIIIVYSLLLLVVVARSLGGYCHPHIRSATTFNLSCPQTRGPWLTWKLGTPQAPARTALRRDSHWMGLGIRGQEQAYLSLLVNSESLIGLVLASSISRLESNPLSSNTCFRGPDSPMLILLAQAASSVK